MKRFVTLLLCTLAVTPLLGIGACQEVVTQKEMQEANRKWEQKVCHEQHQAFCEAKRP